MKIQPNVEPAERDVADAVVIGVPDKGELSGSAVTVDRASDGLLRRLRARQELSGKVGDTNLLLGVPGIASPIVCVVGVGDQQAAGRDVAFRASASAAKALAAKPRHRVSCYLGEHWSGSVAADGVCGMMVGCQGQDLFRSERRLNAFEELAWSGGSAADLRRGQILGEAMNATRRYVNLPASDLDPAAFADAISEQAASLGLSCEIWDAARLEAERCGALLAVARGSSKPPRLVILEHATDRPGAPALALVGKGVTFDSGGLSIKPSDGMKTMKCDMAGAATVVGAMLAIARLELPIRVIGLVGLVENMISGDSFKLGDVLKSRQGKTIEVLNTDAEGRLVLADVLDVAVQRGAERLVDLATLTGACVVALGTDVAGVMSNQADWCRQVKDSADACGELVWELPMFASFGDQIRSQVADIKNIGEGRWGGAITAAKFLEEFVAGRPWTHLDIAGPAFLEKPKPWLDAGASGCMVRTLVELVQRLAGT